MRGIYIGVRKECETSGFSKQGWLAAWLSREFQPRDNRKASCPILSCSALANMMLQLLACLARVLLLAACSRESPARSSRKTLFSCTLLSIQSLYLTHYPYNKTHLNTGLLNAEIQENLAWNKANKTVSSSITHRVLSLCLHLPSLLSLPFIIWCGLWF